MKKDFEMNYEILENLPNEKLSSRTMNYLKSFSFLQELFNKFEITDQEIRENLEFFLEAIAAIENPGKYPYKYSLKRASDGSIQTKKTFHLNSKYKKEFLKNKNLLFTEINYPDHKCWFNSISYNTSNKAINKKEIINKIKFWIANPNNTENINLKNIFVYSAEQSGKSFLLQAIANYCASENLKASYLKANDLQRYVNNLIANKIGAEHFIQQLKTKPDILIIDNFSLIRPRNYFLNDVLGEIISYRIENNKMMIFASTDDFNFLVNVFTKEVEKNSHITSSLMRDISKNFEFIEI
ncbi:ATP-binding protein [Mycoplasmopsis iners]|uniref:ATP-binding protein n=1 Tax=Mycoplasmopsis iners TaxID=76630 RepID=UPI00049642A9|nr:ATP-binding protein [Mycoplasmopsis iners]